MLKHRYNNLSESVSDFKRMLEGMDDIQPLEFSVQKELAVLESLEATALSEGNPDKLDNYASKAGRLASRAARSGNTALAAQLKAKSKKATARANMLRRKTEEVSNLSESVVGGAPSVYQTDADIRMMLDNVWHYMPGEMKTALHAIIDEEQKLADIEEAVRSGRVSLTEKDKQAVANRIDKVKDAHHTQANKHGRLSRTAKSDSEREQHGKMHDAHRRKAQSHEKKLKKVAGKRNLVNSVDPAPLSRYQTESSAIHSFRVLAGLEETELLPRDPGLSGTTRLTGAYLAEGYGKDHSEKMHSTANKIRKAAKTIEKHHKKDKGKDCDDKDKEMEERATEVGYERRKVARTQRSIDPLAAKVGKGPASSPETARSRIKTSLARLKKQSKPNLPESAVESVRRRLKGC